MYQNQAAIAGKMYASVGLQSSLEDATPHRLIEMLFDALLGRIRGAKVSITHENTAAKCEAISKAIAILDGLRASLNHEAASDMSAHLDGLYDYAQRRLVQANLKSDIAILDEVLALMVPVSEAWSEIPEELRSGLKAA